MSEVVVAINPDGARISGTSGFRLASAWPLTLVGPHSDYREETAVTKSWLARVASLLVLILLFGVTGMVTATEEKTAELLTKLVQTGRKVVSDHQALINDPEKGDKGFTPEFLAEKVIAEFQKSTGIDLRKPSGEDGKLLVALLEVEKEVVADAQSVINRQDMGFKGFIPAVFVRKTAEKFSSRSGIKIKFTAIDFRNARNKPDDFERKAFGVIAAPNYPKGKPYQEAMPLDGKAVIRIMFPEYAAKSCLSCHGDPKGEFDITGGKKEGQKEGDLAGALSFTIPAK